MTVLIYLLTSLLNMLIVIVFLAAILLWLALILFWTLFRQAYSDPWHAHLRAMRRSRGQGSHILDDSPRYPWIGRGMDRFW